MTIIRKNVHNASPFLLNSPLLRAIRSTEAAAPGAFNAVTSPLSYNIAQTGEHTFAISVVVPGIDEDAINITEHQGYLTVSVQDTDAAPASVSEEDETISDTSAQIENAFEPVLLHRGIADRYADLKLKLAEHVQVSGAELDKGILSIHLTRDIPEVLQPKRISVNRAQ